MVRKEIEYRGATYWRTGRDHTKNTLVYSNTKTGNSLDCRIAAFRQIGDRFDRCEILGHPLLRSVRIEKDAFVGSALRPTVGMMLLVGPIDWEAPYGPKALAVWPLTDAPAIAAQPKPLPRRTADAQRVARRLTGVIKLVAGSGRFGSVLAHGGGEYFLHEDNAARGVEMRVGNVITFRPGDNGRGDTAFDVRAA